MTKKITPSEINAINRKAAEFEKRQMRRLAGDEPVPPLPPEALNTPISQLPIDHSKHSAWLKIFKRIVPGRFAPLQERTTRATNKRRSVGDLTRERVRNELAKLQSSEPDMPLARLKERLAKTLSKSKKRVDAILRDLAKRR